MVLKAKDKWKLDISRSIMIGDRYKDILFARQLGMTSGLVLTGYGLGEYTHQRNEWEFSPDFIGENLLDLARQIQKVYQADFVDKKV